MRTIFLIIFILLPIKAFSKDTITDAIINEIDFLQKKADEATKKLHGTPKKQTISVASYNKAKGTMTPDRYTQLYPVSMCE